MQLQVSKRVNLILERATRLSARQGLFYVGVEHVYCSLLEDLDSLPERFRDAYGNALMQVLREVGRTAWKGTVDVSPGEAFHTPRCVNVIQQASRLAIRSGHDETDAAHLLAAILSDPRSAPSRIMDGLNIDRGACLNLLMRTLSPTEASQVKKPTQQRKGDVAPAAAPAARTVEAGHAQTGLEPETQGVSAEANLPKLTRDLSQMALDGKLQPAIGRDEEIFEILQVMARKTKNNVMLVGAAGVGKTQVVEGMAINMAQGAAANGNMPSYRILELNIAALMAGTQYRGAFEEKLLSLIDQLKGAEDTILFIDEAHLIMGAGATEGDGMDMANLLKPALARGEIRCIGATTLQEYRKFVERDPAIERRFQMVRLEELSEAATFEVLKHVVPSLEEHHLVRISEQAVETAVKLTQRHMPNRVLPDKAIDVLDQACARFRLKLLAVQNDPKAAENTVMPSAQEGVTPHDIRKVISRMTSIPIEEVTAEERMHIGAIERKIKADLIGQDEAVSKTVAAVKKSRAGLADPVRPDAILLFLGPSGVGKTQLAKSLAGHVFGSMNHLITIDMSEYIEEHSVSRLLGAPPGYAGCEEEGRLTGPMRTTPFSILLLDEIEKAHPRVFDVFLPIFDEGRLKDSRGRNVRFNNCIVIMTSNIGADILMKSDGGDTRGLLLEELRRHFRPEFINRIDEIIPFYPLLREDVRSILRLEINTVRTRLKERNIYIRMYQRAYEYLVEKGYSPEFGARELRRVVDREITTPISDMILSNKFGPNDVINVTVEEGSLAFVRGDLQGDEERRMRKAAQ